MPRGWRGTPNWSGRSRLSSVPRRPGLGARPDHHPKRRLLRQRCKSPPVRTHVRKEFFPRGMRLVLGRLVEWEKGCALILFDAEATERPCYWTVAAQGGC